MKRRVIGYKEALERLRAGEGIYWIGGRDFRAFFSPNETVRLDTFHKLWKDGLITDYGFPLLHGKVSYKLS